jgi:hypothetical protein
VDAGRRPPPRLCERYGFAAILIFYFVLSLLLFNQVEEDAFIYFRLVDNVVHGYGIVFNRGGEAVEAGSSLLWLLLLLLLWKVPLQIVITAKLLGLFIGSVVLWLVLCLSRLHIRDPLLRLAPPLLTAASTPFLMWSQRGLDTPLFVLLVVWLALCCSDPKLFRWCVVPAVLLLPARPEGFFFELALLPAFMFRRERWRELGRLLLVVGVAESILIAARFWYFHDLVPQPFYAKLSTSGAAGLHQVYHFVRGSHLALFAVPLLFVGWRRSFWTRERLILVGFGVTTVAWCIIAKDYMPYARHLVPAIPFAYVLLVSGVEVLAAGGAASAQVLALSYVAAVFVGTLFFWESAGMGWPNPIRRYLGAFVASPVTHLRESIAKIADASRYGSLDQALEQQETLGTNYQSLVGEFLRRNYPADALVVYDQMGQTPFYAGPGMRFVDSLGLTDRTVARVDFERRKRTESVLHVYDVLASRAVALAFGERRDDITEQQALDYLFGLHPDLVLINLFVVYKQPQAVTTHLARDPRLTRDYQLRYVLAGLVLVYEKKGSHWPSQPDIPAGLEVRVH